MKRILIFTICFLLFISCKKDGEVKKVEKVKVEEAKKISFEELKNNEEFKNIFTNILGEDYKEKLKKRNKQIEDNEFNVTYDEFNDEMKITDSKEKETDIVKIELYEKELKDDTNVNDYYIRGNITFNCVGNNYFRYRDIIVLTDNNKYIINDNYFNRDSERIDRKIHQWTKYKIDREKYEMLLDMSNSKNIKIRFTENDVNKDFELSEREKKIIEDMILHLEFNLALIQSIKEYQEKK